MAVRIRKDGRILCAAMHLAEPGDTYIDDGLHHILHCDYKLLVTESWDGGHSEHGEWWWAGNVPHGIVIDPFDLEPPPEKK